MSKTFEIVDGTIKGTASVVVDVSFDINLHDLDCSLEGEALDAEDFLDIMKDNIEESTQRFIGSVCSANTHLGGGVCIEDCTQCDIMEVEIDAEVETKDDE